MQSDLSLLVCTRQDQLVQVECINDITSVSHINNWHLNQLKSQPWLASNFLMQFCNFAYTPVDKTAYEARCELIDYIIEQAGI